MSLPEAGHYAIRAVRLDGKARPVHRGERPAQPRTYAVGERLPAPVTDAEREVYARLCEQGAIEMRVDGKTYRETLINHGPRTVPTIVRTPL